jgi:hypothetical protein
MYRRRGHVPRHRPGACVNGCGLARLICTRRARCLRRVVKNRQQRGSCSLSTAHRRSQASRSQRHSTRTSQKRTRLAAGDTHWANVRVMQMCVASGLDGTVSDVILWPQPMTSGAYTCANAPSSAEHPVPPTAVVQMPFLPPSLACWRSSDEPRTPSAASEPQCRARCTCGPARLRAACDCCLEVAWLSTPDWLPRAA